MTLSNPERRDTRGHFIQAGLHSTVGLETMKFGRLTCVEGDVFFKDSEAPQPQRGGAQALPNFGVPFYLGVLTLTQNDQIWRDNT